MMFFLYQQFIIYQYVIRVLQSKYTQVSYDYTLYLVHTLKTIDIIEKHEKCKKYPRKIHILYSVHMYKYLIDDKDKVYKYDRLIYVRCFSWNILIF